MCDTGVRNMRSASGYKACPQPYGRCGLQGRHGVRLRPDGAWAAPVPAVGAAARAARARQRGRRGQQRRRGRRARALRGHHPHAPRPALPAAGASQAGVCRVCEAYPGAASDCKMGGCEVAMPCAATCLSCSRRAPGWDKDRMGFEEPCMAARIHARLWEGRRVLLSGRAGAAWSLMRRRLRAGRV